MTYSAPTSRERVGLVEQTIARVRLVVVAGLGALLALGGETSRSYLAAASVVVTLATMYAIVMMTTRWRLKSTVSTGLDLAFALAAIALTGAGRSAAMGILFLVLAASALRYSARISWITAAIGSVGAAVVILVVPRPDLAGSLRAELALGWFAVLLLASVLVALLSDLEVQEHADLLVARERARSLAERDSARRRTLSMVAHDLTPPLAAVEGIARTLQNPAVELGEAERAEALGILLEHASHLSSFSTSLRDVANLGDLTKLQRPRPTAVDMNEFLTGLCRAQTFARSREVRFESARAVPMINCDPDKLRRVVVNLIDNAVRHSPSGQPVDLVADVDGSSMVVKVIDSGSGVDDADLEVMFTPEWQGPDAVGESGLGLWIVAELVKELGGSVGASNRETGGLEVEVRLQVPVKWADASARRRL